MSEEFRLYSFVNFYLSPIQAGIQTGHLTDNMTVDYLLSIELNTISKHIFIEWIRNQKTYIVLNGGDDTCIIDTYYDIQNLCIDELNLPYGMFLEPGLGNIMTCCGVVVPNKYYDAVKIGDDYYFNIDKIDENGIIYSENFYEVDSPEWTLIELIKSKRLF